MYESETTMKMVDDEIIRMFNHKIKHLRPITSTSGEPKCVCGNFEYTVRNLGFMATYNISRSSDYTLYSTCEFDDCVRPARQGVKTWNKKTGVHEKVQSYDEPRAASKSSRGKPTILPFHTRDLKLKNSVQVPTSEKFMNSLETFDPTDDWPPAIRLCSYTVTSDCFILVC
jgi:hypothetical protein